MKNFKKDFASFCRRRDGFTLIELLVVVAIIGILASVILASTSTSRAKAGDSAVKSNLNTLKGQSEIFYFNNNNSFLPSGGSTFSINPCPTPYNGTTGTNMMVRDRVVFDSIAEAKNRGSGTAYCYNSSNFWAVAVGLKTNSNISWCVDSGGASKSVASAPASAINATSFACN